MRKIFTVLGLCLALGGCAGKFPDPNQTAVLANIIAVELVQVYDSAQVSCLGKFENDEDKRKCVLDVREDWKPVWIAFDLLREAKDAKDVQTAWCAFLGVLYQHNINLPVLSELRKTC